MIPPNPWLVIGLSQCRYNSYGMQGRPGRVSGLRLFQKAGLFSLPTKKPFLLFSTPGDPRGNHEVFSHQFVGANAAPAVEGIKPLSGKVNFLIGNNQNNWITNVDTFEGIQFHGSLPGD